MDVLHGGDIVARSDRAQTAHAVAPLLTAGNVGEHNRACKTQMQNSATNTQAAYHLIIDRKFWIWDVRYGSVLFIGTRAAGENNPLQADERPAAYALKQRQKKPLYEGLFDGNALPCECVQNTPGQALLSSEN